MSDTKRFTRAEVAAHDSKDKNLCIIHNHVYDLKPFLDEHPGGHEVLVGVTNTDASEEFDDIGHSLDAKDLMKKFRIGELVEAEKTPEKPRPRFDNTTTVKDEGFLTTWKLPIILGILATVIWQYFM